MLLAPTLLYVSLSAFVYTAYFQLMRRRFAFDAVVSHLLAYTCAAAQIVLTELVLGGALGALFWIPLAISSTLFAALVTTAAFSEAKPEAARTVDSAGRSTSVGRKLIDTVGWVSVGGAVLFVLVNLLALIYAEGLTSWDDYHYHMGFVADAIQTGQLRYFEYPQPYVISFPHNVELLNVWHTIFLGSDTWVELTNLIFLFFGALSLYAVLRGQQVERPAAFIAAALLFLVPINTLCVKTTKVDIALASLASIALSFAVQAFHRSTSIRQQRVLLLAVCLASGLIFGSKSSGVVYVAVLFLATLALAAFSKRFSPKGLLRFAVVLGAGFFTGCLVLGSYWYFRSWYYFGNPLFPVSFSVLGHTFPGTWTSFDPAKGVTSIEGLNQLERLVYVWRERDSWFGVFYTPDGKLSGFGSIFYVVMLPALFGAAVCSLLSRNWQFLTYLASCVLIMVLIPAAWIPHYGQLLTFAGAGAVGFVLDSLFRPAALRAAAFALIIPVSAASAIVTANGGIFVLPDVWKKAAHPAGENDAWSYWIPHFNAYINSHVLPGDTVVVGTNFFFSYALIRHDFASKVVMIRFVTEDDWLNRVRELEPRFVGVLKGTPEHKAMLDHPESFPLVLTADNIQHFLFEYKPGARKGRDDDEQQTTEGDQEDKQ